MGLPKGWTDYHPIGKVIPGTRIIAFKTPLKPEINNNHRTQSLYEKRFTPSDCIDAVRRASNGRNRLGLVLNLTFTPKYYNPEDFERRRVHFAAIRCPGHEIPNDELFDIFRNSLYNFFQDYPRRNILVGVHCTHGVNRTGYMIARFLIECEGWSVEEAISAVGAARGYPIERENYLEHLRNLDKPSYMFPKPCEPKRKGSEENRNHHRDNSPGNSVDSRRVRKSSKKNHEEDVVTSNNPNTNVSEGNVDTKSNGVTNDNDVDHIQSSADVQSSEEFIPL